MANGTRVLVGWIALAALVLGSPARSPALEGTGALLLRQKLAVKGCGRYRGAASLSVVAAADGTWTALDSEGGSFAGTYAAIDPAGRKVALTFDAPSLAAFLAGIVQDASDLCEAAVTIDTSEQQAFTFAVNRRGTKGKLTLRYRFTGSAGGESGTAKYRLKAKGPWTGT